MFSFKCNVHDHMRSHDIDQRHCFAQGLKTHTCQCYSVMEGKEKRRKSKKEEWGISRERKHRAEILDENRNAEQNANCASKRRGQRESVMLIFREEKGSGVKEKYH